MNRLEGKIAIILAVVTLILFFLAGKNDNSSRNNYQTTTSGEHEHSWFSITEDTRTCLEEITATYQCRYCEETKTEVMPAPGHSYSGWSDIIRDSCLESGYMEHKCTVCGETEIQTIPPRTSHDFLDYDWVTIKESTCTEEGIQEHKCTQCDEKETRSIPTTHNYVNGVCDGCNRGIINIIIPETPITVHDYYSSSSRIDETCKITSITLKSIEKNYDGSYDITFVWSGEKTYDDDGNNYTSSCGFAYKLYDSEGYVVHSASVGSVGIAVGEKFRNEEFGPNYIDLDPDETYTMEILNLD